MNELLKSQYILQFSHREHTILLNRGWVNKGTKRMNNLPLSPVVISYNHAT